MLYPLGRYNVNFDLSAMAVLVVLLFSGLFEQEAQQGEYRLYVADCRGL